MKSTQEIYFRHCRLDLANQLLCRGSRVIPLRQKSFAVLQYLMEHPGQLVTKEELLRVVWSGTCVSEVVLRVCIRELRHVLRDRKNTPQFIETVHGRGFRFIAPLSTSPKPVRGPKSEVPSQEEARDWRLEISPPSRQVSRLEPQASSLVGRGTELGQLHQWLGKAASGERQSVFVTGEPGIGKTALVEAFLEQVGAGPRACPTPGHPQGGVPTATPQDIWVARGQCIEHYGTGEAYLPILEALNRLCRESGREHLVTLFYQLAPTWLLQMPLLINPTSRKQIRREILGTTRERMLRELTEVVEALTAETLLVLVLEDLHWSDYSTLDFISHLAWRREPARLLLIGTYRPVEVITSGHPLKTVKQELQTHGQCEELPLRSLSEAAIAEYLAAQFAVGVHGRASLRQLAHVVYQRTDGNPLFMVNVVNELFAQGSIAQTDGQWRIQGDLEAMKSVIPENLRRIIEARIDQLSKEEQQVLEAASVAGMEFSAATVAAGLEIETIQAEEWCEALVRRQQFLQSQGVSEWPDGTVAACYRFIHTLYQNVLYERVTVGKRAQLHQRIGEREEKGYGNRAQEIAGALAAHFERGLDYGRAVQYLQQAAENAASRSAFREATNLLTKGLKLLKTLPETLEHLQQELVLQIRLGLAVQGYRGLAAPEAERAYVRARELHSRVDDPQQFFHLLRGLQGIHQFRGEWQRAYELAEQCFSQAQRLQDPALLISSHSMLGSALANLGELVAARAHLEQGIALYDSQRSSPSPDGRPSFATYSTMRCLSFVAPVLFWLGYSEQARRRSQEALTLAYEQSTPYGLIFVLHGAAILYIIRREWLPAQERAEAVVQLATKQGFPQWIAMGTILRGGALAEQGLVEEAIAQIRQGLAAYQATGAEVGRAYHLAFLVRAHWKAGQLDEGLTVIEEALAAAGKNGQCRQAAWLHWLKGGLLLQASEGAGLRPVPTRGTTETLMVAEAEACFQKAGNIARGQSAKMLELRAAVSLSRLWQQQGRQTEARRMLAEIYGWFTEGFDTADLQEARALLEELS